MNTINDMAQLIMACEFDIRHFMDYQLVNYPKQLLLVKQNASDKSEVAICLTYSTTSDTFVQINTTIINEWITESIVLRSEDDLDKCVRLLDLLDYRHSFEHTVTNTILDLVKRDIIKLDKPLAAIVSGNKKYIGLTFDAPNVDRQLRTGFNLCIDKSFVYRLHIIPDGYDNIHEVHMIDRFRHSNVIDQVSLKQLTAHLEWAEDEIVDFLQSMPNIIDNPYFGSDDTTEHN